ncbi:MAG: flagellar hook-associated protein FlgK, partial [Oscillospiraceae bacterium]
MRSTFAGFYIAKSGIDSARANLDITGQNVSNENVTGYTRQRVDVYSRGSSGFNMRYASVGSVAIGEGVNLGGTSQLRDPYLDVRYRREQAKFGKSASELATLKDMEYIFDEIAKDGLDTQFQDFFKQLQNMALNNGDTVSENILKTSSKMLVKMFNYCSSQLEKVKLQEYSYLEDSTKRVNEILSGIADLNKQIKEANIGDNPALELIDSRNMLIDELSGYIPIETQTKLVNIGGGKMVEELSISLVTNGVDKFNLVDNLEYRQLGIVKDSEKNIIQPVKL